MFLEEQLLEHECRKEVLFPTANPQDITNPVTGATIMRQRGTRLSADESPKSFDNGTIATNARRGKALAS